MCNDSSLTVHIIMFNSFYCSKRTFGYLTEGYSGEVWTVWELHNELILR